MASLGWKRFTVSLRKSGQQGRFFLRKLFKIFLSENVYFLSKCGIFLVEMKNCKFLCRILSEDMTNLNLYQTR